MSGNKTPEINQKLRDDIKEINLKLVSEDKEIRNAGISLMISFIKERKESKDPTIMKLLWKGLFYSFWMCDKPLPQQEFSEKMAKVVLELELDLAIQYLDCFWNCMDREWTNLDKHRIDKYYLLMRRFVNYTFQYIKIKNFEDKAIDQVINIYKSRVLNPANKIKLSILYHVNDIYFDELSKVLLMEEGPVYPLAKLVEPMTDILCQTKSKIIHDKVIENFFKKLLQYAMENDSELLNKQIPKIFERAFHKVTNAKVQSKVRDLLFPIIIEAADKYDINLISAKPEKASTDQFDSSTSSSNFDNNKFLEKAEAKQLDAEPKSNSTNGIESNGKNGINSKVPELKDNASDSSKDDMEDNEQDLISSKPKRQKLEKISDHHISNEKFNSQRKEQSSNGFKEEDQSSHDIEEEEEVYTSINSIKISDYTSTSDSEGDSDNSCIATHEFYVEDLNDPVMKSIHFGGEKPNKKDIPKKVRWVLERNEVKVFDKTKKLGSPEQSDLSNEQPKLKGLLKPSSHPILIDRNKLEGKTKPKLTKREKRSRMAKRG